MNYLTSEQEDFLKEIFNLGVAKSCAIISSFSKDKYEVHISVPRINNLPVAFASRYLNAYTNFNNVITVEQSFFGDYNGKATIVYTAESSFKILNLIIGRNTPIELLSDLEKDSLLEMSNIIINSSLLELSKSLKKNINTSLPILNIYNTSDEVFSHMKENDEIILLESDFSIKEESLYGQINLIIESPDMVHIKNTINAFFLSIGAK